MRKECNIIIVGPQASGKGTQAGMLSKELGIPHISTGDIFREMKSQKSELGNTVRDLMNSGKLVPDEITNKIVDERLKKEDVNLGFILDGFPRKITQAEFLDSKKKITHCILVDLSDTDAMKRITARRLCPKCNAGYNTLFLKPKLEDVCDKCGTKLILREDDTPGAVKLRLKKYHEETEPVLKHYAAKGVLIKINGKQEIPKVFEDILKKLN